LLGSLVLPEDAVAEAADLARRAPQLRLILQRI